MSYFKNKYNTDEIFKVKHKTILMRKKTCRDCGKQVIASNMSHHKNTVKHKKLVENTEREKYIKELETQIEKVKNINPLLIL